MGGWIRGLEILVTFALTTSTPPAAPSASDVPEAAPGAAGASSGMLVSNSRKISASPLTAKNKLFSAVFSFYALVIERGVNQLPSSDVSAGSFCGAAWRMPCCLKRSNLLASIFVHPIIGVLISRCEYTMGIGSSMHPDDAVDGTRRPGAAR